jgi:hypothetical protein
MDFETQKMRDVHSVLVVLSTVIIWDVSALQFHISQSYPQSGVFFVNTSGKPYGPAAPQNIDLLIDFTSPTDRQSFLMPRKWRRMARFAVGRKKGVYRKKTYDQIVEEPDNIQDWLEREAKAHSLVLQAAGVRLLKTGQLNLDMSAVLPEALMEKK